VSVVRDFAPQFAASQAVTSQPLGGDVGSTFLLLWGVFVDVDIIASIQRRLRLNSAKVGLEQQSLTP